MAQLTGLTALTGAPTGAGAYTVLASFPGSADYAAATALANFSISQATPTVAVADAGGTYSGTAFGATATVAGVSGSAGASLEGVAPSLSYYAGTYTSAGQLTGLTAMSGAPIASGSYTVLADFVGSADYAAATAMADFSITQATPTLAVADASGAYSGTAFVASATVTGVSGNAGATLEGVSPSLSYYAGTYSNVSQLTGLTRDVGCADRRRGLHGPGQLPRQHGLHGRHGAGELHHRPGDPDHQPQRSGRDVQWDGLRRHG